MQKKKQFIDKSKAVTFRLIYRDSTDPNKSENNQDLRVLQIVENDVNKNNTEYNKNKKRLLNDFSASDRGEFSKKSAIKHKYEEDDML
jgi:hypothetical protein